MADAHRRKKNPEQVRILLIESARRLALKEGLAAVGIDAVANEAGVTKGGLFHHFPSKQALVDAVFQHMLDEFEAKLASLMADDPEPHGRFTRAYLATAFDGAEAQWGPLWMSSVTDPHLRETWGRWFRGQVDLHGERGLALEAVRFAADGVWLGQLVGVSPADREALRRHLTNMTGARS